MGDGTGGLDLAISLSGPMPERRAGIRCSGPQPALVLDEMASRRHVRADVAGTDLAPLVRVVSAQQRLANLVVRGPTRQHPEQSSRSSNAHAGRKSRRSAPCEKSAAFKSDLGRGETVWGRRRRAAARHCVGRVRPYDAKRDAGGVAAQGAAESTTRAVESGASYIAFVTRPAIREVAAYPARFRSGVDAIVGLAR